MNDPESASTRARTNVLELEDRVAKFEADLEKANNKLKEARLEAVYIERELFSVKKSLASERSAFENMKKRSIYELSKISTLLIAKEQETVSSKPEEATIDKKEYAFDQYSTHNEINQAQAKRIKDLEAKLSERFEEIRRLTELLQESEEHTSSLSIEKVNELFAGFIKEAVQFLEQKKGVRSKKRSEKLKRDFLITTGIFDPDWYLSQYPDVANEKIDPIDHYLKYGHKESRFPNSKVSKI